MISVLSIFLPLFSQPTFQNGLFLFTAHVLSKGVRTVTELLRRLNLSTIRNFSKFHNFFSKARWDALKAAEILFLKLITLVPGTILISIDSTVERRKGPKIKGLGIQRDAVRSSKSKKVLVPGLNWLVCAVHVTFPWCKKPWALPFLSILMPPETPLSSSKNAHDLHAKKKHKTMNQWASQIAIQLRRWVGPSKEITLVADSAFSTYILANTCIDQNIKLVSRMRLDARLFDFPDNRGRKGRKRLVGKRLPTFNDILKDPSFKWDEHIVSWYGGQNKRIHIRTGTCLWYGYGIRPVPIRWVLTKNEDNREPVALFSTDLRMCQFSMISNFIGRWQLEVTFEEVRRHLGMETQRQWSDKAVERMTPCILASFSLINLVALEFVRKNEEKIPLQNSSWYKKTHTTFSDVLAYVRGKILHEKYLTKFDKKHDLWKEELEELLHLMSAA